MNVIYLRGGFFLVLIEEAGLAGIQAVLESILHDLLYYCPLKKQANNPKIVLEALKAILRCCCFFCFLCSTLEWLHPRREQLLHYSKINGSILTGLHSSCVPHSMLHKTKQPAFYIARLQFRVCQLVPAEGHAKMAFLGLTLCYELLCKSSTVKMHELL